MAASVSLFITAALASFSLYVAKLSKSTGSQMKFFHYARKSLRHIGQTIRYAKRIEVKDGGSRLECVDELDITSAIYFNDGDDSPLTLEDNRLYWVRNIHAVDSTPQIIASYVSPLPGKSVFAYVDRTSAVEINYRIGDIGAHPHAAYNRKTGPGPQGLTISTAIGPRNSYLE